MPAQSKAQQRFMGMVHAAQQGEEPASPEVAKVAKDMKKSDAKHFASTSHKGLPNHVKQEILNRLKEYALTLPNHNIKPAAPAQSLDDLEGVDEESKGLWANIRAKRARGEKPSPKNSKAYKDAVKAGKEINKNEAVNESTNPREDALLKTFKNIVDTHSSLKVKDGGKTTLIDVQSANAVLKIYGNLSETNKKSFLKMPIDKMIKTAWHILGKI